MVNGFLEAIPLVVGAIVILLLGWIVGRIFGGIVKRLVQGIGPAQYTEGTPLERESDADQSIAQALGKFVKYVIYLLAVLATVSYLGMPVPGGFLTGVGGGLVQVIVAIAILIVGVAIGRFVGGLVGNIVAGLGLDSYVRDTPLADATDSVGGIGTAVGKIVEYLIYFVALLMALDYAGIAIPGGFLTNIANGAVQIIVAGVILVVGFAIGRFVGDLVASVVSGFGLDTYVRDTPLADATDAVGGIGNAVGKLVEFLIYYFALVAAVDTLEFPALSEPLTDFIGQIPLILGALAVLIVGIYVADLLGDMVASVDASRAADIAGLAVQLFVYYIVIVFALDTAGFDTSVLTSLFDTVITAFFGALGLALAIGVGGMLALGGQDFVAENIDDWVGSARSSASDLNEDTESDSGPDDGFESPGSTDD
ncbi:mechanosensitive ion channel family protein [Halococcus salifodinae]|uniref:TM helix repeat-containing protein n=1 Tax=Halococcus salifodinae DSM 8989 TaxID=1227456 RepID=M0MRA2_9EURY|nr:hypothetical protein [Halococcus salifodinae]EMA48257.1 hypothetical protein C450_19916 [Halococcus salifodinae DSM 8989]